MSSRTPSWTNCSSQNVLKVLFGARATSTDGFPSEVSHLYIYNIQRYGNVAMFLVCTYFHGWIVLKKLLEAVLIFYSF